MTTTKSIELTEKTLRVSILGASKIVDELKWRIHSLDNSIKHKKSVIAMTRSAGAATRAHNEVAALEKDLARTTKQHTTAASALEELNTISVEMGVVVNNDDGEGGEEEG